MNIPSTVDIINKNADYKMLFVLDQNIVKYWILFYIEHRFWICNTNCIPEVIYIDVTQHYMFVHLTLLNC